MFIIDAGNTSIKTAVIKDGSFIHIHRSSHEEFLHDFMQLSELYSDLKEIAFCNVGFKDHTIVNKLKQAFKVFEINNKIKLPFENNYQSSTLGNDRIALVTGALTLINKDQTALIIDLGTCITYDYVNIKRQYLGGAISPGVRLRYQSLHNYTAKLPLLLQKVPEHFVGNSTENSIHSGVVNGVSRELDGVINQYQEMDENLQVFLTGGDARLLEKQLKSRFFAQPDLMLKGIYQLYIYNNTYD